MCRSPLSSGVTRSFGSACLRDLVHGEHARATASAEKRTSPDPLQQEERHQGRGGTAMVNDRQVVAQPIIEADAQCRVGREPDL
jgi:hypothetical protein